VVTGTRLDRRLDRGRRSSGGDLAENYLEGQGANRAA
jgi:hypothetical protein